jgi:hypothetical protein
MDDDERKARAAETGRRWEALSRSDYGPQVRVGDGDIDDPGPEWRRDVNHPMWHCDDELDGCPDVARGWIAEAEHIARHDPARVLAEVAAKRRIVQLHGETMLPHVGGGGMCRECESASYPCSTVQHLAAVYADRDGYREEWRPQ